MIRTIIYIILSIITIGGIITYFHLYRVSQNNKKEMQQYLNKIENKISLGKVLVIYYSLSGNTEKIAKEIAQQTSADLFKIETIKKYSTPSVYVKSKQELSTKEYPSLQEKPLDLSQYDTIFVGGPVWWYTMAPPLFSFLKQTDFQGKNVVPFSTQGSNYGKFFIDVANIVQNANIKTAENFNNLSSEYDEAVKNKITTWLNNLSN